MFVKMRRGQLTRRDSIYRHRSLFTSPSLFLDSNDLGIFRLAANSSHQASSSVLHSPRLRTHLITAAAHIFIEATFRPAQRKQILYVAKLAQESTKHRLISPVYLSFALPHPIQMMMVFSARRYSGLTKPPFPQRQRLRPQRIIAAESIFSKAIFLPVPKTCTSSHQAHLRPIIASTQQYSAQRQYSNSSTDADLRHLE